MPRRYRLLILLTCMALACAGLPAHACDDAAGLETDLQLEQPATEPAAPCPHHPAPAGEADAQMPSASTDGADSHCCGVDCSCRCGATAPALIVPANARIEAIAAAQLSPVVPLAPSLSPERLLRPPISPA
ncbi:MAG: hypothetical protein ACXIUM_13065 [Wenzhouxiangella sp.]